MATNTIKRNSTYPPLHFEFLNEDNLPVDCTQFTVKLISKNRHDVVIINSEVAASGATGAVWLDETQGIGEYRWASGDTATPGRYSYEFKLIRNVDGRSFKIPEEEFYTYLVLEDIVESVT